MATAAEIAGKYGALYQPKWAVFVKAPFSASGLNEIIATFRKREEAVKYVNWGHDGRRDIGIAHYSKFKVRENGNG